MSLPGAQVMPGHTVSRVVSAAAAAICAATPALQAMPRTGLTAGPCAGVSLEELSRRLMLLEANLRAMRLPAASQGPGKPMPRGAEE